MNTRERETQAQIHSIQRTKANISTLDPATQDVYGPAHSDPSQRYPGPSAVVFYTRHCAGFLANCVESPGMRYVPRDGCGYIARRRGHEQNADLMDQELGVLEGGRRAKTTGFCCCRWKTSREVLRFRRAGIHLGLPW